MKNKANSSITLLILLLALLFGNASCNKDDNDSNDGDDPEPSVPIVQGDPEGTVTINMNNAACGGSGYDIGIGRIGIDNANNFTGVDFVCLGEVEGIGYVTTIPTEGWSNSVAAVPGQGYVAHYQNQYARLYVVEFYSNTQSGIMGATIKYQSPFQVPISTENTSLDFSSDGGTQTVRLASPTSLTIDENLDWCEVSFNFNTITISVTKNVSTEQRFGEIVLKNDLNTINLNVLQQGIVSFEGGSGTEQDPYLIKTAQQLANINTTLDAHYALISDINMASYLNGSGEGWVSIGTSANPFKGTFDGRGHTISEMWGNSLFGIVENSNISDVYISSSSEKPIHGPGIVNGCFGSKISKCKVSGFMENAGIAGYCSSTTTGLEYQGCIISECSVFGTITLCNGGVVGGCWGFSCDIRKCYVSASLYGDRVGGICGEMQSAFGNITECVSEGIIQATNSCNGIGLLDWNDMGINNCYSTIRLELLNANGECKGIGHVVLNDEIHSGNHCYFAGSVNVTSNNQFSCYGQNTYYDADLAGIAGENGRTTTQMKRQSTYEGWDFVNTWRIDEGIDYPKLRCFD